MVTSSALVALQFLIWCGLARCPGYCKHGRKWNAIVPASTTRAKTKAAEDKPEERKGNRKRWTESAPPFPMLLPTSFSPRSVIRSPSKASLAQFAGKEPVCKGVQCRQAASWCKFCPVAYLLPDSIGPQKLVGLFIGSVSLHGFKRLRPMLAAIGARLAGFTISSDPTSSPFCRRFVVWMSVPCKPSKQPHAHVGGRHLWTCGS